VFFVEEKWKKKRFAVSREQTADGSTQMTRIIFDFCRSSVDIFYLSLCANPDHLRPLTATH